MTMPQIDNFTAEYVDELASAISRRLPADYRAEPPSTRVDVESLASAIAHRLPPVAINPPQEHSASETTLVDKIVNRLRAPSPHSMHALASAVVARLIPPTTLSTSEPAEIDANALAQQVLDRISQIRKETTAGPANMSALANAIASRVAQPTLAIAPIMVERVASEVASALNRRLNPAAGGELPADLVDATQLLKEGESEQPQAPAPK